MDIVPTILDLCGLPLPAGKSLDGISLKGLILGTETGRDTVVSQDSIRTGTRKYYPQERFLADLKSDPGELNDIAAREPETATSLLREWERRVEPFRRRYDEAVSTAPQRSSFYFPVDTMRLEAADSIHSSWDWVEPSQMVMVSSAAWFLHESGMHPVLFALPGRARSGALVLSAPVPKGEYRVSVAVLSPEASTATLPPIGYRFSAREKFLAFEKISPLGRRWRESSMNYFLYRTRGWVRADEGFRIELTPPSTLPDLWGVAQVRFEPRVVSESPPVPARRPEDDAALSRLMRERGYW